ncbi:MAG: DinB family protein [Deltaproteobacteria bacterium]|nr:MAG: DinB family protein [Deltaproteobacteria bacterium]
MADVFSLVRSILETTPGRWEALASRVPEEVFSRRPAPSEWSARECLLHMIDTETLVFPVRVECILKGEDFPAFDPDAGGGQNLGHLSPAELAERFSRARRDNLKVFEKVKPEDLGKKGIHGELGPVTMEELISQWAGHDLMHLVQAERAIMQVFIEKCGPWKPSYSDHIVGEE